jgi:hypothetical protein
MTKSQTDLVQQFVAKCLDLKPHLVAKIADITELANTLVTGGGEAIMLPASAQNLGTFLSRIVALGMDKHREESLQGLSAGSPQYIVISTELDKLTLQATAEVQTFVDALIGDPSLSTDIETAAGFIAARAMRSATEREAQRIYMEVIETKPATVWDAICIYPFVMLG